MTDDTSASMGDGSSNKSVSDSVQQLPRARKELAAATMTLATSTDTEQRRTSSATKQSTTK